MGKNGWICAQESAGSAHNEMEGPLVEIGSRSVFGNSAVGVRVASGGGSAHDLTPLVVAWGGRTVAGGTLGANHASRAPESG